ncbi:MAG TPA: DUF177 domain-containing protein [Lichenihabitans sp.]|jgi:hypothetical protein|nr:DUF177 domain-containing protein [Lichenihabitans sp.]
MVQGSPAARPRPSRVVDTHQIGTEGMLVSLSADAAECRTLADVNGLVRIESLQADMELRREGRTGIHVTGTVRARITQTCVVTLDDFVTDLAEPVDVHFLPEREAAARAAEAARLAASPSDAGRVADDLPDAMVDGKIDLASVMAEFLALGLDPYPRKPGAAFVELAPAAGEPEVSPFAALARLKSERPN